MSIQKLDSLQQKYYQWNIFLLTVSNSMKKCLRSKCRNLAASRQKFGHIFTFFGSRYYGTNRPVEYYRGSLMRKFLAIKINCTLNMYFPRPRLKRRSPGLAPDRGTREGGSRNSRFCHFFVGRGFDPRLEQKWKSAVFFFFLLFLCK